jgi:hypothetical protein
MAAAYRTSTALGSGSATVAPVITTVTGDLLIAIYVSNGTGTATCTDNQSGTWTKIAATLYNASGSQLTFWVRDQLVVTGAATTVTMAGGGGGASYSTVIAVSGMNYAGTAAIVQSAAAANQASGSTPAVTFSSSVQTAAVTIGAVSANTLTPPTNWLERTDAQQNPGNRLEVITRDSGFTGTTITWGNTAGANYAAFAIELQSGVALITTSTTVTAGAGNVTASQALTGAATTASPGNVWFSPVTLTGQVATFSQGCYVIRTHAAWSIDHHQEWCHRSSRQADHVQPRHDHVHAPHRHR